MLKMDMEYKNNILFVRLIGILNRKNSYKINNYIIPVIRKHGIKYLIYNFEKLKSINESGVDAIINSKCEIKRNKGKMLLCKINNNLTKSVSKAKCKIINSEKEAVKLIGA